MQTHIVATKQDRLWLGIPGIERAANGRLWCTFYSGGPREPDPDNLLLLTTSADDGASWSTPEVIVNPAGATRAYDPALWHDPAGCLWLIYNQANLETREFDLWAMTTDQSSSARPRWTAPRRIAIAAPFAVRLNKPIVLRTGEWLLPVTWGRKAPEGWFPGAEQLQGVAISTDGGASWALHGAVEAPPWALENMLVVRRDGSLWMLIRTGSGVLWQSYSSDGGRTWAEGTPTGIINPGVRFFVGRIASGRLLLINTPDPKRRQRLCAYLSEMGDDGVFRGELELDARDRVSYPDAVQAPDGTIYAVHDCDRNGAGEIIFNVFAEREILAQAVDAGDAR
jgi:predicted neuraminidase